MRKYSQTHFCTRQNKINVKSIEHTKELMLHWNRENKKEAWTQPKNCSFWRLFLQFLKYRDSQLDTYLSSTHSHWSVLNFIDIFFLIFDLKISRQKLRNIWQWKIERELFRNFIYSVTKLFLWLWSWIWIALPCAQYSVIRKKKLKNQNHSACSRKHLEQAQETSIFKLSRSEFDFSSCEQELTRANHVCWLLPMKIHLIVIRKSI